MLYYYIAHFAPLKKKPQSVRYNYRQKNTECAIIISLDGLYLYENSWVVWVMPCPAGHGERRATSFPSDGKRTRRTTSFLRVFRTYAGTFHTGASSRTCRAISSDPFFRLPISTVSKKNTLSLIPHSQREHHSIPYLKPHATHRRTCDGHVCWVEPWVRWRIRPSQGWKEREDGESGDMLCARACEWVIEWEWGIERACVC